MAVVPLGHRRLALVQLVVHRPCLLATLQPPPTRDVLQHVLEMAVPLTELEADGGLAGLAEVGSALMPANVAHGVGAGGGLSEL